MWSAMDLPDPERPLTMTRRMAVARSRPSGAGLGRLALRGERLVDGAARSRLGERRAQRWQGEPLRDGRQFAEMLLACLFWNEQSQHERHGYAIGRVELDSLRQP